MGFLRISVFWFPTGFLVTRDLRNKNLRGIQELPSIPEAWEAVFHREMQKPESCYLNYSREPLLHVGLPWSFSGFVTRNLRFRSPRTVHRMGLFLRYCSRNTCNIRLWNRVAPETEAQESLEPPNCLSPPFCTDLAWRERAAGSTTCMPLITSLLNLFSQFS